MRDNGIGTVMPLRSILIVLLVVVATAAATDTALTVLAIVQPVNEQLTNAVYRLAPPWLDWPMIALTYLGCGPSLFAIAAILSAWALSTTGRRIHAVLLLASFGIAEFAQWALKLAFQSPRPELRVPPLPVTLPTDYGFPSGHALASSAVLGVAVLMLWQMRPERRIIRWAILAVGILLIAGIGFSRIYLGVHWVNDVIGGYLYGALILLLAWIVLLHTQDRDRSP